MSRQFLWIFIFLFGFMSGEDVKKAVGDVVTFGPDSIPSITNSILWKHRDTTGTVVKAIEWDRDDGFDVPNLKFKDITRLNESTGAITINNLRLDHTGLYTIEINSKEQEKKIQLTVMERVPKPKINKEQSGNPNVMYLTCKGSATVIWRNSTGELPLVSESLTVRKTGIGDNYYTCTFQNAVSRETSDPVYERDLFPESSNAVVLGIVIFIIIIIIILIVLPCLYLFLDCFHDPVQNCGKDVKCFGGVLTFLDRHRKTNGSSSCDQHPNAEGQTMVSTSNKPKSDDTEN
ncbi:uncharacterized protein LOC127444954 [Myxocyprinus asiaticus]|uniref:uncharacterized protein LOC127444954 n=1 Tax=Myxocyprinus asiaticus TaxID=70543 RepID=UPI00222269FE|nr:uncharacterized protein LOC127444954 [Myxocyprinus asiaticus]XP_051560599.1 uncharacterized protein LOC127444954 [Myxocyprinus asiaticus]XP_051560600.1 uncharacterized protein LOC127444954 [Myxocyprinus asiaticus]XP_051560601.1 uncharacterized protein LOC127444954 [Myxocyprinus asiaticus]XP_051560602.1 uncharacterized protein LOC127444954 [Myxocyprinus asiaticus]XP_051560603.1 uncharacterized protein LOC127444954 [Myxocyprinus asiaticus]